jgi:hypothetical protein
MGKQDMKKQFSKLTLFSVALVSLVVFAPGSSLAETVSSNAKKPAAAAAPSAPSAESISWTSELVTTCRTKEPAEFNAELEKSRRKISTELNKLSPEDYGKLSDKQDSRVVFIKMTWPKDISYANDHFSNDSDRTYCAKLHKIARDNVASTSSTKAAALQAVRDFENCVNLQFNGNNELPLPSPFKELVACYREKAKGKQ